MLYSALRNALIAKLGTRGEQQYRGDLQVRFNSNKNDTARYGGEHVLYDIKQGHLTALMTTHEARRLATQNTASGNDLHRKAIHDT